MMHKHLFIRIGRDSTGNPSGGESGGEGQVLR